MHDIGRAGIRRLVFAAFIFLTLSSAVASASSPADELSSSALKGARSMHGDPVHFGSTTRVLTDGVQ